MKTNLVAIIVAILFVSFFGCSKEKVTTVTNNVHDTICIQPTKEEILTAKTWEIDELYRSESSTTTHFVRGGINTTGVTYENMRFTFESGGTGTYIDEVGTSHTLSWTMDSDFRNATLTIGPPFANTFTWNLIEINGSYLHNTSVYAASGSSIMQSARFIQVP